MLTKRSLAILLSVSALSATQAMAGPARDQAANSGVRSCLPIIEQVENFIVGRQVSDAVAFVDLDNPDRNPFSSMIAAEGVGSQSIASLNVTPSADGKCVAEYTRTSYLDQSCMDYAKSLGNQVRYLRDLGKRVSMFQDPNEVILLSNAGKGCLMVRKQLLKLPSPTMQAAPAPATAPAKASTSSTPKSTKKSR